MASKAASEFADKYHNVSQRELAGAFDEWNRENVDKLERQIRSDIKEYGVDEEDVQWLSKWVDGRKEQ